MTDEVYTLMETNRERAITKNSAFRRVTNKKPKSASYGVEGKTAQELALLNGPLMSYDMKKFYTREDFMAMPADIREHYIKCLIDRYEISYQVISTDQFGMEKGWLLEYLKRKNSSYKSIRKRGNHFSKAGTQRYLEDLAAAMGGSADEKEPEPSEQIAKEPVAEIEQKPVDKYDVMTNPTAKEEQIPTMQANVRSAVFEMDGLDDGVFEMIRRIFGDNNISVKIEVTSKGAA